MEKEPEYFYRLSKDDQSKCVADRNTVGSYAVMVYGNTVKRVAPEDWMK